MSCDRERLELYLDGELTLPARDEVRAHLERCEACRGEWEGLQKLEGILRRAPAGREPEWDSYVRRVVSRGRGPRVVAAAAAVLLVGLTLWNVYDRVRRPTNSGDVRIEVRKALERFSEAPTESAREAEVARIRAQGDAALPILVAGLEDPSPRVQIAAARVLGRLKDERVRELLIDYTRKQESPALPEEEWGLEEVSPRLVTVAMRKSESEGDVRPLIDVIGRGPVDPEIGEAISKWVAALLGDSQPKLRRLGLEILRETGVDFLWNQVVPLLDDPEVGRETLELLRERTGADYGPDKDRWNRHFKEM